jgi:hypothetical protein
MTSCNARSPWITYDWDNSAKFPWLSNSYRRYLDDVQCVTEKAVAKPGRGVARDIIRRYFRALLHGIASGLNFFGIDLALLRCLKTNSPLFTV